MLLHTPVYILYLSGVTLVYWILPGQARKPLLLIASYVFYAWLDLRFLALLACLTLATYLIGRTIPGSRRGRALAWLSVIVNLGILALFKWAGFFIAAITTALQKVGIASLPPGLTLLLPVGISFFTFQAIAYTTEIYRKKTSPSGLLDYAIYLAFFPKLLAGPLVRPNAFLHQLTQPAKRPDRQTVQASIELLIIGLVKKVVIADSLASLSDVAFRAAARPVGLDHFPALLYWQGFYLYSFLIYADFSGYTDIARASAALLGFNLPENFQQPYLSENITAFWNRWHMSLTQWFREYLFFSLSRSLLIRLGRGRSRTVQVLVTLITMVLIGVWHGAAWTFVLWGAWHGFLLVTYQQLNWKAEARWQKVVMGFITFHLVGLGWIFFGSSSLAAAFRYLQGLLAFNRAPEWGLYLPPVLLAATFVFGIDLIQRGIIWIPDQFKPAARPILITASIVLLACLALINLAHGTDARPFIYGRF